MTFPRRLRSAPLLVLAGQLSLMGCAGHGSTMRDVRAALVRNDLERARAKLADASRGTGDLLFALEDGLLLHYAGDPELSNVRLEFVEARIDDLYTKSITRAVLSLVASDLILKFEPSGIESFLVNYYRALNYLQLGQPEEAWVEWRKLASKLQYSREQGDAEYLDPPFFHHLIGLGLELDDPSNAYVSMRLAEAGYRDRGVPTPPDLVGDLERLAIVLGFPDHVEEYRARYSGSARGPAAPGGEIVLLVEEGLVAPLEEVRAYIPISRQRARGLEGVSDEARIELSVALAREYGAGQYRNVRPRYARSREIAYVLPLAFPVFGRGEPAFRRLRATVGGDTTPARVALDVSALQQSAFEDRLLGIVAKTIARTLVKSVAAAKLREKAEKEGGKTAGDVVGILANIVNVATERADTRAWLGLPHRIWMVRLRVPPGRHDLQAVIGEGEKVALGPVDVRPGERVFISYRAF